MYPMDVGCAPWRAIRVAGDGSVEVIDQTRLPHELVTRRLASFEEAAEAIRTMVVRGAPLIGATAACGMALALRSDPSDAMLDRAGAALGAARPTAVNLRWAVERVRGAVAPLPPAQRAPEAWRQAELICEEDASINRAIGEHGRSLLARIREAGGGRPVRVLTHCNAGRLATVEWGTALAPVYVAGAEGIDVHVWVTETRPRNQGSALTAWELARSGVPHTVVVDGAAGHLMQRGLVDCCLVGTDRTAANGDVCNKVGTYPLALCARDNAVPFYAAVPGPSIDWSIADGLDIPIEERDGREVSRVAGRAGDGSIAAVTVTPPGSRTANPAFDVTPGRLLTGLVTERGVCAASRAGLASLFPEFAPGR